MITRDFLLRRIAKLENGNVEMYIGKPDDWETYSLTITGNGDETVEDWSTVYNEKKWLDFKTNVCRLISRSKWVQTVEAKQAAAQGKPSVTLTFCD